MGCYDLGSDGLVGSDHELHMFEQRSDGYGGGTGGTGETDHLLIVVLRLSCGCVWTCRLRLRMGMSIGRDIGPGRGRGKNWDHRHGERRPVVVWCVECWCAIIWDRSCWSTVVWNGGTRLLGCARRVQYHVRS